MSKQMKKIVRKMLPYALLTVLGAAGGYWYYHTVGCVQGACPIASNPFLTVIYCGAISFLMGVIIMPNKKKEESKA